MIAPVSDFTGYANANHAATALVDPDITGDPAIYPNADVRNRLELSWSTRPRRKDPVPGPGRA